jgi:UDP-3-O-acyl-N-acetylglucosamine deacetylase
LRAAPFVLQLAFLFRFKLVQEERFQIVQLSGLVFRDEIAQARFFSFGHGILKLLAALIASFPKFY